MKNSNLTPAQQKLVRTPAFKAWFGDWENSPETASKVVDENGEPLVVRHFSQTNNKFYIFKEKEKNNEWSVSQKGIYFTSANSDTVSYFYNRTKKGFISQVRKGNLYEVFLNVRNLLDLGVYNAYDFISNKAVDSKAHDSEMTNKYITKGRSGVFTDFTEYDANVDYTEIQEISEISKNKILKLGYNGVWGVKNSEIIDEIVVFEPEQIKLADGSNKTFDSINPDIRFDGGGSLNSFQQLANKYNNG